MRNSVDKRLLATTFFAAAIVGMPLSASFAQSTHRQTTDEHYSRLFVPFWVKEGCAGALIPWGTPPYSHKDCITYTTKQTTVTEEKKHKHHHHKKYRKDRDHHKKYGKDHDRDHKKYGKDRDHDKYGKDRDHDK